MTRKTITNPFFVLEHHNSEIRARDVSSGKIFKSLSRQAVELLHQGLPGVNDNIDSDTVSLGQASGILVPADIEGFNWEEKNWSRAAYLTFSQMDLQYEEPEAETASLKELNDYRRKSMGDSLAESHYPEIDLVDTDTVISLKAPTEEEAQIDLDGLMRRKSVRSFADTPVSFQDFSYILHESTMNIRVAADSQASGDPFYILNSFYCWVKLYIVVQGVKGIERGIYQYDPIRHELRLIRKGVEDEEVYECIQHQYWIKNAGFCIFISSHWERYMWVYRHSRAYINLMIQSGELGQEIYVAANKRMLGGWGTPAISESVAANLLGLDPFKEDAIYFLKIGPRKEKK